MYYPLNIILGQINPYPLFGELLQGEPFLLDLSSENPGVENYDTNNFDAFQKQVFDEMKAAGYQWGVGRYLEERRQLLQPFPQMVAEGRFYHVGLDIIVAEHEPLFAPLDATVAEVGLDGGVGNYGGYVMLRHEVAGVVFYSFYGHLQTPHHVRKGEVVARGEVFGHIGAGTDSGGWFTHTHLQMITPAAYEQGRHLQGYITAADLPHLEELFPSPYPLFRVR